MRRIAVIGLLALALLAADPAVAGPPEPHPGPGSVRQRVVQSLKKLVRLHDWLEARSADVRPAAVPGARRPAATRPGA